MFLVFIMILSFMIIFSLVRFY